MEEGKACNEGRPQTRMKGVERKVDGGKDGRRTAQEIRRVGRQERGSEEE